MPGVRHRSPSLLPGPVPDRMRSREGGEVFIIRAEAQRTAEAQGRGPWREAPASIVSDYGRPAAERSEPLRR